MDTLDEYYQNQYHSVIILGVKQCEILRVYMTCETVHCVTMRIKQALDFLNKHLTYI